MMKDSKYYRKIKVRKNNSKIQLTKLLLSIIIILLCLIIANINDKFKNFLSNNVLEESIRFSDIHSLYDKYIGKIQESSMLVGNTNIEFINMPRLENDGVYTIEVGTDYMLNFLKPGIIVYMGEKDDFGETVIVQGNDGIDIWYGNVLVSEYSLYDYVSEGDILGTSVNNEIKLAILKDGEKIKYEDYFKEN